MNIISFGGTDTGRKRDHNEDACLAKDSMGLYAVADGIGGSAGGEVASRLALEALEEELPALIAGRDDTQLGGLFHSGKQQLSPLARAFSLSNQKIRRERERNPGLSSMGTTLTALLLKDGRAYVAHVGDSRAYLLRSGKLTQLTNDHSFVAEQVRAGVLTVEQARTSPYRHVIVRALGIEEEVAADVKEHALQRGDTLLLCTDGLTEMVDDREINRILAGAEPREATNALLKAANDHGGVDNITAVVVRVVEP